VPQPEVLDALPYWKAYHEAMETWLLEINDALDKRRCVVQIAAVSACIDGMRRHAENQGVGTILSGTLALEDARMWAQMLTYAMTGELRMKIEIVKEKGDKR